MLLSVATEEEEVSWSSNPRRSGTFINRLPVVSWLKPPAAINTPSVGTRICPGPQWLGGWKRDSFCTAGSLPAEVSRTDTTRHGGARRPEPSRPPTTTRRPPRTARRVLRKSQWDTLDLISSRANQLPPPHSAASMDNEQTHHIIHM